MVSRPRIGYPRSVPHDQGERSEGPAPGDDAFGARDAKAGGGGGAVAPRVVLMVNEAYRHAKPIGGWSGADAVLDAAAPGRRRPRRGPAGR
ncbi:hypothetical protein [Streptomyces tremellae]|uniref:hypothetical protein n=1 Tax=Streptomyces tremellae TaxID=1124239 RepID=UPI0031E648F1